tara:strand:- start:441 stop:611 length:171 start_codon:yes stop_codon:yes gene_type:complete
MNSKKYPFIIKIKGKPHKLECFYGKCMFRRCDEKGRVFRTTNVIPFKTRNLNIEQS